MGTTTTKKKRLTLSEKNKRFWKLPAYKKRIAVAKDVIEQLTLKTIKAKPGTYISFNGELDNINFRSLQDGYNGKFYDSDSFDTVFNSLAKEKKKEFLCEVCGLGAAVVCMARLGNQMSVEQVADADNQTHSILLKRKIFSTKQSLLIETAFEGQSIGWGNYGERNWPSEDAKYRAVVFGKRFKSPTNRLMAIYQNIIDNKGEFIP